jgi:hypothetical protein
VPELVIGKGAYKRENGNSAESRLENMLVEPSPIEEKGFFLLSRPPLVEDEELGAGPVWGLFQQDGLFGGDRFVVSGENLYRDGDLIDALPGTGAVQFEGSDDELVILRVSTGITYSYDGLTLEAIVTPDDFLVSWIAYRNKLHLFGKAGTGVFYWSDTGDARVINALDYAEAESEPDQLYDGIVSGDNLYLLGATSIEVWVRTGNADLPFRPVTQRNYSVGVMGTNCAEEFDNAIHLIGSDGAIYRLAEVASRISDHGMEERIVASTTHRMFSFKWQGHLLMCIRLDDGTWALDLASSQWSRLLTYGSDNWRAYCAINIGETPYFGDDQSGVIWGFGGEGDTDCGLEVFPRVWTGGAPLKGPATVFNVIVEHNAGATPIETGQGSEPYLEMRFSRDSGRTFSIWRGTRLGAKGQYRRVARFGSCGLIDAPIAVFEFQLTDPGPLRVSSSKVNEPLSGRGRV